MKRSGRSRFLAIAVLLVSSACGSGDSNNDERPVDIEVEEAFSFAVPVVDHTAILLEAINGEIDFAASAAATSVQISGIRRVGSDALADAERHLADLFVDIEDDGDRVLVHTVQPRNARGRNYEVEYIITAPPDLQLLVTSVNGPIIVRDAEFDVLITSVNGPVTLERVVATTAVSLVNGNIDADVTLPQNGELDLSIVNGDIDLEIPAATSADFSAMVANGSVTASNLDFNNLVQNSRSVTGILGSGAGTIDLDVINGAIRVEGRP